MYSLVNTQDTFQKSFVIIGEATFQNNKIKSASSPRAPPRVSTGRQREGVFWTTWKYKILILRGPSQF